MNVESVASEKPDAIDSVAACARNYWAAASFNDKQL